MGISRTVSERRQFQSKIAKFSHPLYFAPPLNGLPLEMGTGAWDQKTRMMGLPGRQKSSTITSAVWIQCTNVMDGRTDGRTPGHSKDRTYA